MLIYLASPYTHSEEEVMEWRARKVCCAAAELLNKGHHVISPISFCHFVRLHGGLSGKFDFWQELDHKLLDVCDELWVLGLLGWDVSVGVLDEIEYMNKLDKPVYLLNPVTYAKEPL